MRLAIKQTRRTGTTLRTARRGLQSEPLIWAKERHFDNPTLSTPDLPTKVTAKLLEDIGEKVFFGWLKKEVCSSGNNFAYSYFESVEKLNLTKIEDKVYIANETFKLLFWENSPAKISGLYAFAQVISEHKEFDNYYEFRLNWNFYKNCAQTNKIAICSLKRLPKTQINNGIYLQDNLHIGYETQKGVLTASAMYESPFLGLRTIWSAIAMRGIQSKMDLPDYYNSATSLNALAELLDFYQANLIKINETRNLNPKDFQYQLSYSNFLAIRDTVFKIDNKNIGKSWALYEQEIRKCGHSVTGFEPNL